MLWTFWTAGCTWGKLWACEAKHRWMTTSSMNQEINFSNISGILSCSAGDLPVFWGFTAFLLIVSVLLDCDAWGGYFSVQLVATCWLWFLSPGFWRGEIRVFFWYLGFSRFVEFNTVLQWGCTFGIWEIVCLMLFATNEVEVGDEATTSRLPKYSTSSGCSRLTPTDVLFWATSWRQGYIWLCMPAET